MSDGPDEFISSVYGTGMSYEEKVAAEQAEEIMELEKAAAVEAFTDAMLAEGLDPQQFSDEQLEAGFSQFYEDMTKQAALVQDEGDAEEMVKQAWAEADAIGRQLAQQDFILMVKEAREWQQFGKRYKRTAKGRATVDPTKGVGAGAAGAGPQAAVAKPTAVEAYPGEGVKDPTKLRRAAKKSSGQLLGVSKTKREAAEAARAAAPKVERLTQLVRKYPKAAKGIGAGVAAAQLAALGGAGYLGAKAIKKKQQEKAASLETPFLDDAIEKTAMAIAVTEGAMTPDGETNMTSEGEYIYEPTWVDEYELEMPKTALDEAIFNAALVHLEELGYPVNWEGEEE